MYVKRVFRLFIFVALCLFIVSMNDREVEASLKDIPPNSSEQINYLIGKKVIDGYPDGTFRPQAKVTRQEAVTMVARALGLNGQMRNTIFVDVPSSLYSSGYVQSAYEQKLLTLNSNKTFRPEDSMTRGEVAYFLQRAFNLTTNDMTVTISDVSSNNGSLYNAVNAIITNGLSDGYPDGSFKPNNVVTREEFSLFVARGLNESYRVQYLGKPQKQAVVDVASWDVLNVRSGPGTAHSVVGSYKPGTTVTIYNYQGDWALVSNGSVTGYVNSYYLADPNVSKAPTPGKTITIDPGHGGHDPGAVGNGLQEKEINLSIALKVQKILKQKGINVVMTRTNDTYLSLSERVDVAVRNNSDTFVSIHTNSAAAASASGTETYFSSAALNSRSADSKQLATFIQKRLYPALGTKDRKVKDAGFQVIKKNPLPAVLVELGFISNSSDASKLGSDYYRNKAAEAIALGIVDYYNWKN